MDIPRNDSSRYQIDRKNIIAKGPYGTICKGVFNGKDVAIKIFEKNLFKTKEEREKFNREITVQALLHHLAILPLDAYTIEKENIGQYSIVTRFMPNGNLDELVNFVASGNSPDNWETIKMINVIGIAAGMAYIHQHNVIHRVLKPNNIYLDENFYPKIANFSLSKKFKEGTENQIQQTLWVGTPIYMAPEVLEDEYYSNKIDVFSYGMLLYYLLTYIRPWSEYSKLAAFQLFFNVTQGKRPELQNKDIPEFFKELITKCWSQDPSKRPSFIQIVKTLIDNKENYMNHHIVNEEELDEYIEDVIKDLSFDKFYTLLTVKWNV